MKLAVKTLSGPSTSVEVSEKIFSCEYNEPLIHQIVVAYLSGSRAGTKKQKTRSEVRGGGRKPWKQKGTGRARAGTIRSPIWRTGGVAFAARPRDFTKKVNKKMYRKAMWSMLSELLRLDRFHIVEEFNVDQPKTKAIIMRLKDLGLVNRTLIITDELTENLYFSVRNLPGVHVIDALSTDPVTLLKFDDILVTTAALKKFEEMLDK